MQRSCVRTRNEPSLKYPKSRRQRRLFIAISSIEDLTIIMKVFLSNAFILALGLVISSSNTVKVEGGDVDCTSGQTFTSLSQQTFTMSMRERSYSCYCRGDNCSQMICTVLEVPAMRSGDSRLNSCRDRITGRYYARGAKFLRHTSAGINLSCKCPRRGTLSIRCDKTQCTIPPPINDSPAPPRVDGSCYDKYTNSWHEYNVPYTRRVVMSYSPDIIGVYKCTCNAFQAKCKAVDLPCCDARKGKFVAKTQRFLATIDSSKMMDCMCMGGRGRIGDCREPKTETPEIPRKRQCYDRTSRNFYNEHEHFIKYLRDGTDRTCACKRRRNKMQIHCSRRN